MGQMKWKHMEEVAEKYPITQSKYPYWWTPADINEFEKELKEEQNVRLS